MAGLARIAKRGVAANESSEEDTARIVAALLAGTHHRERQVEFLFQIIEGAGHHRERRQRRLVRGVLGQGIGEVGKIGSDAPRQGGASPRPLTPGCHETTAARRIVPPASA